MPRRLRLWIGAILRTWAERIDPDGAVTRTGMSFTFEALPGGIRLRTDGLGCPLYRVGTADLRLAHTDSDTQSELPDDWDAALVETVRLDREGESVEN